MKNKISYIIALMLSLIALNSCDNFINGVVREFDLPEVEQQPTPFMLLDAQDTAIDAVVSWATGILDDGTSRFVENANITVSRDGNVLFTMNGDDFEVLGYGLYRKSLSEPIGAVAGTYELRVEVPDYEIVTATQQMPSQVMIDSVAYTPQGYIDPLDNWRYDEYKLYFSDPIGEENYYAVEMFMAYVQDWGMGTDTFLQNMYMMSQELYVEDGYYNLIFKDVAFDGQQAVISFGADEVFYQDTRVFFRLYSITEDYYRYLKSFNDYDLSFDNPFSEPTLIHSNTNISFGCFGLSNSDMLEIQQ